MKNYKIDFATSTLTITEDFAMKLEIPNSDECRILEHYRNICPNLRICQRKINRSAANINKGLTFARMEKYIRLHENADELLLRFSTIKAVGDSQSNKYGYVAKWFREQFPEYGDFPEIVNGRIKAVALIDMEEDNPLAA